MRVKVMSRSTDDFTRERSQDLQLLPRERKRQEYLDAVKERYKHLPEVKRIADC